MKVCPRCASFVWKVQQDYDIDGELRIELKCAGCGLDVSMVNIEQLLEAKV